MEHILQFGVNIDDDAIVKTVTKNVEAQVMGELKSRIKESVDSVMYYRGYGRNFDNMMPWVRDEFVNFLENNKSEIISQACDKLVSNLSRTKMVREAVNNALKELD